MIIVEFIMVGLIFALAVTLLVVPTHKLEQKVMSFLEKPIDKELKQEKLEISQKERELAEKIELEKKKALQKVEDLNTL